MVRTAKPSDLEQFLASINGAGKYVMTEINIDGAKFEEEIQMGNVLIHKARVDGYFVLRINDGSREVYCAFM